MQPGFRLNIANVHIWAAVVSGTAWKQHTLGSGGVLTAEYIRGPLILWATRPGEGEMLQADGPAVSALEDRIDRLNTAQIFERFKWVVRGNVPFGACWKFNNKAKRCQATLWLFKDQSLQLDWDLDGNTRIEAIAVEDVLRLPLDSDRGIFPIEQVMKEIPKLFFRKVTEKMRDKGLSTYYTQLSRSKVLAALEDFDLFKTTEGDEREIRMENAIAAGKLPSEQDLLATVHEFGRSSPLSIVRYFDPIYMRGTRSMYLSIWRFLRRMSIRNTLRKTLHLKRLEATAYRAHVTRRVKPTPRRHRIRRPLYARPRPPSAPLAPPVI